MRVLLVGTGRRPIPPPGYGGIERTIAELADALRQSGEDVTILNGFRPDHYTTGWSFERRLPWLLRRRSADIVHVSTSRAALVLGLAGIPYVFTSHTPRWLEPSNALQLALFEREKFAVRFAQATIALTEDLGRAIDRVGARRGPVVRIPIGVDAAKFRAHTDGIPHRTLGVGTLERRKRWHLAARAIEGTDIRLRLVGATRHPDYAVSLAKSGCELLGVVPEDVLLSEFENASFVFHPSSSEVLPGAVLQAMAFSRPVLGGLAIRGIPGTITSEATDEESFVSFLHDWAVRLDTDAPLRRELGAKSRAVIEREYAWPKVAEAHVRLYRQVMEGE